MTDSSLISPEVPKRKRYSYTSCTASVGIASNRTNRTMRKSPRDAGRPILMYHRKTERMVGRAAAAVVAFALGTAVATAQDLVRGPRTQRASSSRQSPLRLILQTTKRVCRAGEPIHITAYLENESEEQTFYVGRDLDGFCAIIPLHYIELRIMDHKNRRMRIVNSAGAGGWREGITQREKIQQEYVPLGPKGVYGQKDTCEIRLKKGRYRMRAVYHE